MANQTTSTRILSGDGDPGAPVLPGVRRGFDPPALLSRSRREMADASAGGAPRAEAGKAPVAQRIDPAREKLSPAQLHFMRQVELSQWQKTLPQRRGRNILTGLSIGALVLAIYGYTFYSVAQERFLDDLEDKAKAARVKASGTNSS
ncbi:cytochrome c oxidase assembly factor 3 homolog, mitochondrial [Petaurus breviceps papuanus]|uniref:cytochrome c oxidase assembly factor 3 homolog, mitochondrial n=1 Tax=Petaurus breviceps papuanus TaxID=3040969 RepID=UPI0036DC5329